MEIIQFSCLQICLRQECLLKKCIPDVRTDKKCSSSLKMSVTMVGQQRTFQVLNGLNRLKQLRNFCVFSGKFLNIIRIFLVYQNNFYLIFSFYKGSFHKKRRKKLRNVQFRMRPYRPVINFHIKSFQNETMQTFHKLPY